MEVRCDRNEKSRQPRHLPLCNIRPCRQFSRSRSTCERSSRKFRQMIGQLIVYDSTMKHLLLARHPLPVIHACLT